jgi:hypothetical protein
MKAYGGVDVQIHIFLTSALARGEWSALRPGLFTLGKRAPGTHWVEGWVEPRTGLDDMDKWKFLPPPGLELRPVGRPARSQSMYRLRYPVSSLIVATASKENVQLLQKRWWWHVLHVYIGGWGGESVTCPPTTISEDIKIERMRKYVKC